MTRYQDQTGWFYTVQSGNESVVHAWITAGVDVNITDNEGKTALFYAVQQRNNELVVGALIDAGADVNRTDNEKKTALFYAVQNNNESVVRRLIAAGADVNITDNEGKTALFYAVQNDSENVVKVLVKEGGALVDSRDIYGRTPLFYAIAISQTLFEYLLGKKGNLHIKDWCNVNILTYFIETCSFSRLQSEIEKRLKVMERRRFTNEFIFATIINFVFCKVLHITFGTDSKQICEALEISKRYIATKERQKKTTIQEVINLLREENSSHKIGSLCVSLVPKVLDLLLKLGVSDPNAADASGNTILHYATRLPFWGLSQDEVDSVFTKLKNIPNLIILKNHNNESPLLFSLSRDTWELASNNNKWSGLKILVNVVRNFLSNHGLHNIQEITRRDRESVFHLILNLFHFLRNNGIQEDVENVALELLELILSQERNKEPRKIAVNQQDFHLNSPLHLWAKLTPRSTRTATDDIIFKNIFGFLSKNGAQPNQRNSNDETPLHVSGSWLAVELLLEKGANPKDLDSRGRSPLVAAAKNKSEIFRQSKDSKDCFYPDVSQDPKTFWITALEKKLDLCTVDKNGESVVSILIEHGKFVLAQALLEVAREKGYLMPNQDPVATNLLNAICKDKSNAAQKIELVKIILDSRKTIPIRVEEHLRFCCTFIEESYRLCDENTSSKERKSRSSPTPAKKARITTVSNETDRNVHVEIVERLLQYGANRQTCSDIADKCPVLNELFSRQELSLVIQRWTSRSSEHRAALEKVARGLEHEVIDSVWYHRDPLYKGTSGTVVFAGIDCKDGKEVALKRTDRDSALQEIKILTNLQDCKQVVRYITPLEDNQHFYVVLELMEGNLGEYLKGNKAFDIINFGKDLLLGLKYMHSERIYHCAINLKNILFKSVVFKSGGPKKFCFKFAFGSASKRQKVLESGSPSESDIFSFGRVLLYCLYKAENNNCNIVAEPNDVNDDFNTWEKPPCPEAQDLVLQMIDKEPKKRITADEALNHPWFWSKKKKMDFLYAVGNQIEITDPRAGSEIRGDLDGKLKNIIKYEKWDDLYPNQKIALIKHKMKKKEYDTNSVAELLHFIRNVISHTSDLPPEEKKWVLNDYVFLESYPSLVLEVLRVVKQNKYNWHLRKDISNVLAQEEISGS